MVLYIIAGVAYGGYVIYDLYTAHQEDKPGEYWKLGKAALSHAVTIPLFYLAGSVKIAHIGGRILFKIVSHGIIAGIFTYLRSGNFWDGAFIGGGVSTSNILIDMIPSLPVRLATAGIVGATIAWWRGASTAGIVRGAGLGFASRFFNDESHDWRDDYKINPDDDQMTVLRKTIHNNAEDRILGFESDTNFGLESPVDFWLMQEMDKQLVESGAIPPH